MNIILKRSAIMVSLLVIAVLGTVFATRVSFAEDFFTIRIEYKYQNDNIAHDPYVAVLRGGENLDVEVTNPVIPGYKPKSSAESTAEDAQTTTLKYQNIHESDTITVYYLPDTVHYRARYFKQNIRDDLYTEDLSLSNDYYEKSGYTGTFPEELEKIEFEGFTSLFHEPDSIAADGSTEFKLYYDRNYYLVNFDLGDGGYGVDPVYAKQGTAYTISTPKRMGYNFLGWVKSNENGDCLDKNGAVINDDAAIKAAADPFTHGVVPIGNSYYKAVWEPDKTKYSVVYWIENADDDDYSIIASKYFDNVESGFEVKASDTSAVPDFFSFSDMGKAFPEMSSVQVKELEGHQKYFQRVSRDENPLADEKVTVSGDGTTCFNVCYKRVRFTLQFFYAMVDGNKNVYLTNGTKPFSNSGSNTTVGKLKNGKLGSDWINAGDTVPQISSKYSSWLKPKSLRDGDNEYLYYQIDNVKYNANMRKIWLVDALTPVHKKGFGEGETCHFGSWAVENKIRYKQGKTNFTIKGIFERLGDDLMFTDNRSNFNELHYLASWTNTDTRQQHNDWNYKEDFVYNFTYKNYVELLPEEYEYTDGQLIEKKIYTDVVENNGKRYGLTEQNIIETYDSGSQYTKLSTRDQNIRSNQTPAQMTGFEFLSDKIKEEYGFEGVNPQSEWFAKNGKGENNHADVKFFYRRCAYSLSFCNDSEKDETKVRTLYYNEPLSGSDRNGNPIYYVPKYHNADLADYYRFDGWYSDPFYTSKIKMNDEGTDFSNDARMAADDDTLYARFVPITCDLTFCNDYRAYSLGKSLHAAKVDYGSLVETSEVPKDDEGAAYRLTAPSNGAMFAGWYYIDENRQPVRFDPETIPVTRNLELYAEWVSKDTAKYKVTYTEQGTGIEVADPTIGTVFVSKTKTFTAKSGSELNKDHSWKDGEANWWPTMSSHSLMIRSNSDGSEFEPNTFNFEYIHKSKVWYQVRYIDKETGRVLRESQDLDTAYAAVTECAQYVEGYVPDKLSRSIVLSASVNSDEALAKQEELNQNQIIFFYTPSENGTLYQIDHYIEDTDDSSAYSLYYSETQTAVIGDTIDAEKDIYTRDTCKVLVETGFSVNKPKTAITVNGESAESNVSVKLDGNVTVISVYYSRNSYPYTVKYYDYEAEKLHDADPTLWDGEIREPETFGAQPVGKKVNIDPPETLEYTFEKDGKKAASNYTRIGEKQLSITIRPDSDPPVTNVIKVYYKRDCQRKISYRLYCNAKTSETYATLSKSQELVENEESITGCTVTMTSGFRKSQSVQGKYIFMGWYADPTAYKTTEPLSNDTTYYPEFPGADMTFYAVFEMETVQAVVEVRYNSDGVYTGDDSAAQDTDGSMTGFKPEFSSPLGYTSGEKTPYLQNSKFVFSLNKSDNRMYKYEFAGWYEVLKDGKIIKHDDITSMTVDKDARIQNYRYIAMFKEKKPESSLDIEIRYRFETRTNGLKDYVFVKTLSGDELTKNLTETGAYELTDEYIMGNAPFESNFGKTLCWKDIEKTSDAESKKLYTVVYAEQKPKKVYAHYRLTPSDGFETIETTVGANRILDNKLAVLDLRDKEYGGKQFSYWEIRKSESENSDVIARCYDPWFTFCIMDNYWISPVFEGAEQTAKSAEQKSVTISHLGYSRNRWTDSDGNIDSSGATDLLYTDFEIAFADGQEQIYGSSSDYKAGVVLEVCGVFNGESFDPNDYNFKSDETNLKKAIVNQSKVYNYDSSDSQKKRSIQISNIPTGSLTNKNRVEFFKGFRNKYKTDGETITYTNKTYIMKATAYLIDPNGNVTLSNSEYVCLSNIAAKNLALNGVCVSND